jgi:outer membrane receptor protein involved in Fe transport
MKQRDTKQFHMKPLAWHLACLFGAMAASTSMAQTAPAADADPEANKLERIEVTVQRRLEDNQAVPASVSAVGAKKLADRNITDVSQMEGMAAGFTFGRSGTPPSVISSTTFINHAHNKRLLALLI